MASTLVLFLLSCSVYLIGVQCQEPCLLHLKDYEKTPVFRPFVYTLEGAFYKSQNYIIKIPNGQVAVMSCQNNFFRSYPSLHNLTVKCEDDSLIVEHDKNVQRFKDLNCDLRVVEEVKHNVVGCSIPSQGTYYQYFDSKESAYNVFAEVCYNYESEQTNFIRFQLPYNLGPQLQHQEVLQSNIDIPHRIAMLSAYRADKTTPQLKGLLTEDFYLAQEAVTAVKLFPKVLYSDQLYEFEKFDTNFVGLWTTVADGNWGHLMSDIEEYTKDKKQPIEVIIGTQDTLKLSKPGGEEVQIFLKDGKVPLPRYVWSVIHDKKKKQAVAVITINNPFIEADKLKKEIFCENVCEKISWLHRILKNKNYDRTIYGYTFCCSMDSFKKYPTLASTALLKD